MRPPECEGALAQAADLLGEPAAPVHELRRQRAAVEPTRNVRTPGVVQVHEMVGGGSQPEDPLPNPIGNHWANLRAGVGRR